MRRRDFLRAAGIYSGLLFLPRGAFPSSRAENIILLTVDTLRADRLGFYGYDKNTSPHLDRLAGRAVVFDNATCNTPLTGPSFTSMFTSLYPHETGAIRNGIPMVEGITTVAELFKKHGYHTAAVLSNWPLKRHLCRLHKGFDLYDDRFEEKRWLFFNDERDAARVTEHALAWLKSGPPEPFFAWIHYSDPHAPYISHRGFEFEGKDKTSASYDSEVAYTDHHIGTLIEALEAKGLLSRSLLLFTADHGESLGEHNYTGHGRNLYQQSMHIPFFMLGPDLPRGERRRGLVQVLDIAPTLLAYAGIEPRPEMRGKNLLPLARGEEEDALSRTIYLETYPGAAPQIEGAEKVLKKPIWVGYRQAQEKVLFSVRFQRWEVYDLAVDPEEQKNLARVRDPDFVAKSDRLLAWYEDWAKNMVVGRIDVMSAKDREKFKALGYVGSP